MPRLSRERIRANLVAELTGRFPARHGGFSDELPIASLGFPNDASRREWGKQLNRSHWFTGWFTPTEFLSCVTVGPVDPPQPNLVDLLFDTQVRSPEQPIANGTAWALPRLDTVLEREQGAA